MQQVRAGQAIDEEKKHFIAQPPEAQPVEVDLSALAGKVPMELFGRVPFPAIGDLPYFVTLPPYGFYWFSLVDHLGDDLR